MRQLALAGIARREAQGNRGRIWQDILDRTHGWYAAEGWGKVYSIRNEWAFASRFIWERQPANKRARTGEGGLLMRMKSAPDYVGSIGPWPVQFDAKEFAGPSIGYDNFSLKQIADLNASFVGGNRYSGFMVLEKRTMNVWWCQADYIYAWHQRIQRNERDVVKSINFSRLDFSAPRISQGIRLLGQCAGYRFDYAPALFTEFTAQCRRAA